MAASLICCSIHRPQPLSLTAASPRPAIIVDHQLDKSHESAPWFVANSIDNVAFYVSEAVRTAGMGDYLVRYSSDNRRIVICFNDHGQESNLVFEPSKNGYRSGDYVYPTVADGLRKLMTKKIHGMDPSHPLVTLGSLAEINNSLPEDLKAVVAAGTSVRWQPCAKCRMHTLLDDGVETCATIVPGRGEIDVHVQAGRCTTCRSSASTVRARRNSWESELLENEAEHMAATEAAGMTTATPPSTPAVARCTYTSSRGVCSP